MNRSKSLPFALLVTAAHCGSPTPANTQDVTATDSRADVTTTVDVIGSDVATHDVTDVPTTRPDAVDAGPVNPLDGIAAVELVHAGFMFIEGPQWMPALGVLVFSDQQDNTIYQLHEPNTTSVFRMPSSGSNGLTIDTIGHLIVAEATTKHVTRLTADPMGAADVLASDYMGSAFHAPNDLVVRSDGTIYFTDPAFGSSGPAGTVRFAGLYRIAPDTAHTITAEWQGPNATASPNGLALSPNERTLYLDDTDHVTAFDVNADGSLTNARMFASTQSEPDGMAVDRAGNVFVTAADGIEVFAPDAHRWGTISVPMQPSNVAFAGTDGTTLYITARTTLYRTRVVNPGIVVPGVY